MTEDQIQHLIAHYARPYPEPLLTSAQAAAIAGRSVGTIHNWSSLGKLGHAKTNSGRLRIDRDAFVRLIVTGLAGDGGGDDDGSGRGRAGTAKRPRPTQLNDLP